MNKKECTDNRQSRKVALAELTTQSGDGEWTEFVETGVRERSDRETIDRYVEAMTENREFPPVVLYHDGVRYWIADGFHRIEAARRCEFKDIEAEVHEGKQADAIWFALGANREHGRPMTRGDRSAAVKRALATFPDRCNREIARQIGCDDKTIAAARAAMESTAEIPQLERTVGADGKARPTKRTKEPSSAESMTECPGGTCADSGPRTSVGTDDSVQLGELPPCNAEPIEVKPESTRNALELAQMAIEKLNMIAADDPRREEAFAAVEEWLAGQSRNTQQPNSAAAGDEEVGDSEPIVVLPVGIAANARVRPIEECGHATVGTVEKNDNPNEMNQSARMSIPGKRSPKRIVKFRNPFGFGL